MPVRQITRQDNPYHQRADQSLSLLRRLEGLNSRALLSGFINRKSAEIEVIQEAMFKLGLIERKGNITRSGQWDGVLGDRVRQGINFYARIKECSFNDITQLANALSMDITIMDKLDTPDKRIVEILKGDHFPLNRYETKVLQYHLWKLGFMEGKELKLNMTTNREVPAGPDDFDGIWYRGKGSTDRCVRLLFNDFGIKYQSDKVGQIIIQRMLSHYSYNSNRKSPPPEPTQPVPVIEAEEVMLTEHQISDDNLMRNVRKFTQLNIEYSSITTKKGEDRLYVILENLMNKKTDCYGFILCAKGIVNLDELLDRRIPKQERLKTVYWKAADIILSLKGKRQKHFKVEDQRYIPSGALVCANSYKRSGSDHWAVKLSDDTYVDFTGSVNYIKPQTFFRCAKSTKGVRYYEVKV